MYACLYMYKNTSRSIHLDITYIGMDPYLHQQPGVSLGAVLRARL